MFLHRSATKNPYLLNQAGGKITNEAAKTPRHEEIISRETALTQLFMKCFAASLLRGNTGFFRNNGAGDGSRTRDPKLGKLVLYQLSYARFSKVIITTG